MHQLPRYMLLAQVENGLVLLALGMGVVFVFLLLLVYSTKLLSAVVRKFSPPSELAVPKLSVQISDVGSSGPKPEVAAAIAAAIARSKR